MPILAICDDNRADIEGIECLVREWCTSRNRTDIRIVSFTSAYKLLDAVSRSGSFDLFLLDILMPEMTGIVLGEHLQQLLVDPLFIFLTASEDYYSDAFRLYAFQYLCKPIRKNALFPVLDKAFSRYTKRENNVFFLKTAEGLIRVPMRDIVYVELLAHVCHFHLEDGQHLVSLHLRTGFDCFAAPLLQHRRFIKTHASYIVNLDFVGNLSSNSLFLTTGKAIPVTRSFAKDVQQCYVTYGLGEE